MKPGIYIKDRHDGEEIRHAIQVSTWGLDSWQPVTFRPESASTFSDEWADWLDGRWTPVLAPHLVEVYMKSRAQEIEEIVLCDAALATLLDADEAARSREAGTGLAEATRVARHHKVLQRFVEAAEKAGELGHAPTIFSIQAAAFNLPLFSTLVSYLYLEWKAGALALPERAFETDEARFSEDAIGALGGIRELLQKCLGDFKPAACA